MGRAKPYSSWLHVRPFEERNSAPCGPFLVSVEQMPVMHIVLVDGELHASETQHFCVESPVDLLVRRD